jgi:hypothetical protein
MPDTRLLHRRDLHSPSAIWEDSMRPKPMKKPQSGAKGKRLLTHSKGGHFHDTTS